MHARIGLCILVLSHLSLLSAQNTAAIADSLARVVGQKQMGKERVDLLAATTEQYGFVDQAKAMQFAQQTLEEAQALGYTYRIIFATNFIGLTHMRQGKYKEALEWFLKALHLAETAPDTAYIAKVNNNLGTTLWHLGDRDDAKRYYHKSLQYNQARGADQNIGENYINLGVLYAEQQALDSALLYYHRALPLFLGLDYTPGIGTAYNNIARIHERRAEYGQALFYYQKALDILEKKGYPLFALPAYNNIGIIQTRLKQYPEAQASLQLSLEKAQAQKALKEQMYAYEALYQLYIQTKEFPKALSALEQFTALKDSIYDQEKNRQATLLRKQYEAEQRQSLMEKDAQIEHNKLLLSILIFAAILLLLSTISILYVQNLRKNSIQRNLYEKEKAHFQAQQELETLRHKKLHGQLTQKQRELASNSMNLVQKNELLNQIEEKLQELKRELNHQAGPKVLNQLIKLVEKSKKQDQDWDTFKMHFEQVNPGFFDRLLLKEPRLTPRELRLCAYLKMNLSTKEIATLLNYSVRGIETARYRLRKKLDLPAGTDLNTYMMSR